MGCSRFVTGYANDKIAGSTYRPDAMSVMTNLKWQHFDIKAKLIMSRTQIGVMTETAWRRINLAARGGPDAHTCISLT